MIKLLKKKFIFTAMIAVAIVLVGVFGALNIVNHTSLNAQSEKLLYELARLYDLNPVTYEGSSETAVADTAEPQETGSQENAAENTDGADESNGESEGDSKGESEGGSADDSDGDSPQSGSARRFEVPQEDVPILAFMVPEVNDNTVLGAVYFTVSIDENENVVHTDISKISGITEEQANKMALEEYKADKAYGWKGNYRYLTSEDSRGNYVYIFLDRTIDLNNQARVLMLSVLIVLACFGVLFVLVSILSNKMIKPIAENIERQKCFITDAGHEIKTPLAIIQANTEALELHEGANKWTDNIKNQSMRLSILMTNMLLLAKADDYLGKEKEEDVDLDRLINDSLNMFDESFEKKGLKPVFSAESNLIVRGCKTQYAQLISILLDNIVKYSRENSEINIRAYSKEKSTFLEMGNYSDYIPECDPERLFDRFYRPDATRYSQQVGNGIGLAAARAIMQLYDGTIECTYDEEDHIVFTMMFKNR